MGDSVFYIRSLGTSCEGLRDQYADGKAARVWEAFIGSINSRTQNYNRFLIDLLRTKGCRRILDVACGTGMLYNAVTQGSNVQLQTVDSVMLLEEGFEVISIDASDKMLKYALKKRWKRRKEKAFDEWVIEEANWLTLSDDINEHLFEGFDAVICLGNSFAHLIDTSEEQLEQKRALYHFEKCVKPGGLLIIDHRNFDHILNKGYAPTHCIYYNSPYKTEIQTSVLYVAGKPAMVIMDYLIDIKIDSKETSLKDTEKFQLKVLQNTDLNVGANEFRLSYYPHKLKEFTQILDEVFPKNTQHTIYGDFKPLNEIKEPGFYIHVLEKSKSQKDKF